MNSQHQLQQNNPSKGGIISLENRKDRLVKKRLPGYIPFPMPSEEPRDADRDHNDRRSQERYAAARRQQTAEATREQVRVTIDRSGSSNDPSGN